MDNIYEKAAAVNLLLSAVFLSKHLLRRSAFKHLSVLLREAQYAGANRGCSITRTGFETHVIQRAHPRSPRPNAMTSSYVFCSLSMW